MSLACEDTGPVGPPVVYRPRRPAETALFRVVRGHLETFLDRAREDPEHEAVSEHVERTFREYLKCGILAQGFARARCPSCGLDVLVAFSCKKRGVCPSCEGRHRVETAARLVDQVIPRIPVRHWVLSLPRRVRYFCRHRPVVASAVLRIFLRAVETRVRQRSPGAPRGARFGAVAFEHRGGSFLNPNYHWHVEVTDGVFAASEAGQGDEAEFFEASELTEADVADVEAQVRLRVLRWLARHDVLDEGAAEEMLSWDHQGGFSLDASTRIEAWDRHGLERVSRYCARAPFSLQRLVWVDDDTLVYRYPRPAPDGSTELVLSPLELLTRLARLIPPPYRNRVRYFGVLASNAKLRKAVVSTAGPSAALQAQLEDAAQQMGLAEEAEPAAGARSVLVQAAPVTPAPEKPRRRLPSVTLYCWSMLLARIYEVLPLQCTRCGAPMRIIAFVTERESVRQILEHLGEPSDPPRAAPARGPPQFEFAFDQTVDAPCDEDLDQTRGFPEDQWA